MILIQIDKLRGMVGEQFGNLVEINIGSFTPKLSRQNEMNE